MPRCPDEDSERFTAPAGAVPARQNHLASETRGELASVEESRDAPKDKICISNFERISENRAKRCRSTLKRLKRLAQLAQLAQLGPADITSHQPLKPGKTIKPETRPGLTGRVQDLYGPQPQRTNLS